MNWVQTIVIVPFLVIATSILLKTGDLLIKGENEREWKEAREEIEEYVSNMEETEGNKYVKERLLEVLEEIEKIK